MMAVQSHEQSFRWLKLSDCFRLRIQPIDAGDSFRLDSDIPFYRPTDSFAALLDV